MVGLPRALQLPPAKAEALLRGYLNTWAMYGLMAADGALFDDMPDLRADQYPVARRFYSQGPQRSPKSVRQLYDAIREATEARKTMHLMDKTGRPERAEVLAETEENRAFDQMDFARKQLSVIRRETDAVERARTLEETQQIAQDRARFTRRPGFTALIERRGAWNAMGALKRFLIDDLLRERNKFARRIMKDIENGKAETKGLPTR